MLPPLLRGGAIQYEIGRTLVSSSNPRSATFAERYREHHGLTEEAMGRHILNRALYLHTRPIAWFLRLLDGNYFAADTDFIDTVSSVRGEAELYDACVDYIHHPDNRGFMRRGLHLRTSTARMQRLVRTTLSITIDPHNDDQGTILPMGKPKPTGAENRLEE